VSDKANPPSTLSVRCHGGRFHYSNALPVSVDLLLNLAELIVFPRWDKKMPKAALWLKIFFDRRKSIGDIRVPNFAPHGLLERPHAGFDCDVRDLVAEFGVESPAGRADGQREE
jgi:hypothetical protein